jgi:hypothetical protein
MKHELSHELLHKLTPNLHNEKSQSVRRKNVLTILKSNHELLFRNKNQFNIRSASAAWFVFSTLRQLLACIRRTPDTSSKVRPKE